MRNHFKVSVFRRPCMCNNCKLSGELFACEYSQVLYDIVFSLSMSMSDCSGWLIEWLIQLSTHQRDMHRMNYWRSHFMIYKPTSLLSSFRMASSSATFDWDFKRGCFSTNVVTLLAIHDCKCSKARLGWFLIIFHQVQFNFKFQMHRQWTKKVAKGFMKTMNHSRHISDGCMCRSSALTFLPPSIVGPSCKTHPAQWDSHETTALRIIRTQDLTRTWVIWHVMWLTNSKWKTWQATPGNLETDIGVPPESEVTMHCQGFIVTGTCFY